jgi:hypothetical protein
VLVQTVPGDAQWTELGSGCSSRRSYAQWRSLGGNAMAFTNNQCIQDQYGNRYTLNIDAVHQYITGTVASAQGGGPWILTASYVQSSPTDPWIFELTVTNASGTAQSGFVPVYKLKGVEPSAAWYYEIGYRGQEFTFTSCTAPAPMAETGREALQPGEQRGARTGEQ